MKLKSIKILSILFGLLIYSNNLCIGQIDFQKANYQKDQKIYQKVKLGKFGCDYEIIHKIGANEKIKESRIQIPNMGCLKINFDYNEHGDITHEKVSFNSQIVDIEYHYNYETINPEHNNLTLYKIAKQSTTINGQKAIEINSIQGGNTYETLKEQLTALVIAKDQAIFELLEEHSKTKKHNIPTCNCHTAFQVELIERIYEYKLFKISDKDGVSIGSGKRDGILHYVGDNKRENWRLEKVLFNYNQSTYLVEYYVYKK